MKYVLNKDLPTFKAGTEAWLSEGGHLVTLVNGEMLIIYVGSTLAKFPNILTEWFEPIPEKRKAVPEGDDTYYAIFGGWDVSQTCGYSHFISQGNWRWTQEEAEAELVKRAAIERVRRYLVRNDLLEEDKTNIHIVVHSCAGILGISNYSWQSHYVPYGRIRCTDITQFLEDCREDLLLIHL